VANGPKRCSSIIGQNRRATFGSQHISEKHASVVVAQ